MTCTGGGLGTTASAHVLGADGVLVPLFLSLPGGARAVPACGDVWFDDLHLQLVGVGVQSASAPLGATFTTPAMPASPGTRAPGRP